MIQSKNKCKKIKILKPIGEEEVSKLPQLPENWKRVRLNDLCFLITDGKHGDCRKQDNSGYFFISAKDIFDGRINYANARQIKKEDFEEVHKRTNLRPNDILITNSGTIGRIAIATANDKTPRTTFQKSVAIIKKPNSLIDSKYLAYHLENDVERIKLVSKGTAQKNLLLGTMSELIIVICPLPEQRAIVSKIEQLFSELDNGISNLKLAQEQLKVYRQAVLDKTTNTEKFVPINNIIDELGQGWSPKCHNEPSINNEEWGVIKTTAIQAGYFNESENKKLPTDFEPRVKHELKAGDILITRAGPRVRVGVCCLVKKVRQKLINCDKAYRIRPKENLILPQFFEYTLNSPKYTRMMENLKTGINDSGVNLTQNRFLDLEIPLPSLPEQEAIVEEIETRLSVCDKIEQDIKDNLERAEALRQSILKKAFEGKLLNERELSEVRKAEDWEPAEVLLERIKAERAEK